MNTHNTVIVVSDDGPLFPNLQHPFYVQNAGINSSYNLSQSAIDRTFCYCQKAVVDVNKKKAISSEELRAEEEKCKIHEISAIRKGSGVMKIFENSDAQLCIEIKNPNGIAIHTEPITSTKGLKMTVLYGSDKDLSHAIYNLSWDEKPQGIYLSPTEKHFFRRIGWHGVCFHKTKCYSNAELEKAVIGFLLQRAEYQEIPDCQGFSRDSKGNWRYAKCGEINFAEIKKRIENDEE